MASKYLHLNEMSDGQRDQWLDALEQGSVEIDNHIQAVKQHARAGEFGAALGSVKAAAREMVKPPPDSLRRG